MGINAPSPEHEGAAFEQHASASITSASAPASADVDELHGFLKTLGAKIIRAPREDQWATGY
ncbi:hypothetical protein [Bradyrhizobium archetypum]|uniref:hypothetical protein n=1 Tax=Bradyrhizobium archetypum TaxID=2721160 RepID=UPI001AEDC5E6|nr:hypothetical protein [Bradyrhizobium archetypum]